MCAHSTVSPHTSQPYPLPPGMCSYVKYPLCPWWCKSFIVFSRSQPAKLTVWALISMHSFAAHLSIHLPPTLAINASMQFRHFASQSIVKMISLFMRNVCQMYLTDASLAYTPCLPTCSTVETSYIHTYLNRYPCHPHPHPHSHTYTVEFCQYSWNCETNLDFLEFSTPNFNWVQNC